MTPRINRSTVRATGRDASRVTPFEARVYALARRIPRGRVTTYGALARAAGCGSARAVGQALRRNPFAPRVPCHRVIASDLRVGGFSGRRAGAAILEKKRLLAREGVRFCGDRIAEAGRVWYPRAEAAGPGGRSTSVPPAPRPRAGSPARRS